jgi:cell wall-associated NlpC family hydrolase
MYQKRELAIQIAWQWYGKPYLWSGDDPLAGTDCSGLWVEILKSVGILPHQGDWSADMLWKKFKEEGKEVFAPHRGVLAFWRRNNKMIHVEMCIDEDHTIGASGGGSRTTSLADAIKDNAFVKVRPFNYRGYPDGYVNPFL